MLCCNKDIDLDVQRKALDNSVFRKKKKEGLSSWNNFVVDFKEVGKSFTLNKEVWAKATTDAMKNGKDPAIVVVMGEGNTKVRLAIIEMSILEQLVEGV
jgi:hypothetical protein